MGAMAGAIAGAIWGAFNQHLSNRTQWKYLQAQGQELRNKARVVRAVAAAEVRMFARQAQYRIGKIEASFGSSGVAADSGSAFDALMTQVGFDALSKLNITRNAEIQARDIEVSATFSDYQRKILDRQLPIQMVNGALQGAAAGMGMGGNLSGQPMSFGQNFMASPSVKG